jgi:hypothetical protein
VSAYPGQGHPWADFLHYRMRAIVELWHEDTSPEEIARLMSMDPFQAILIYQTAAKQRNDKREVQP